MNQNVIVWIQMKLCHDEETSEGKIQPVDGS